MDSRFAHLFKRDSSVSMIRVKMSRRRSQSQKENREKMQNLRRNLDQLPELELSMNVSLEKSVISAQQTEGKANNVKNNRAAEERKKMLARFKETKALQKEKDKREKEKKGVFKVGVYRPQPLGYLPVNPVVPSTAKTTEHMHTTRVTRSMKQQQQLSKLPIERQVAPKKAELASSTTITKPSAPVTSRSRVAAVEPVVRAPTTRSVAKSLAVPTVTSKAVAKPATEHRVLKTRSANKNPAAPSTGKGKALQGTTVLVPPVEKPAEEITAANPAVPAKEEKKLDVANVTPTSFAPQGFVFQPPVGLKAFQPAPLSPRSADAFLSPSFSFEPNTESTTSPPPPSACSPAPPLSSPPSCRPDRVPTAVSPCVSTTQLPTCSPPPPSPPAAPLEAQHDVPYFRGVMAEVTERLTGLSDLWESRFDDSTVPEEMRDQMRMAVGQARLLMKERFTQFGGLVDDCELGRGEKITTCTDLQGFWDMVYFQVEDVDRKFNALKEAEARGWQEETKPVARQKKVVKKPPVTGSKTGAGGGASAAAKSRLAAVKAAMKAKQAAAEKSTGASDDPVQPPANAPPSQTVVFHGGFFQVESPVKAVGAARRMLRLNAAPLQLSSPCVSKCEASPNKLSTEVSHPPHLSLPSPCMPVTHVEAAHLNASPTRVPRPTAKPVCTPHLPADPVPCLPKPLQMSHEHHETALDTSNGMSQTDLSQPDHDTSLSQNSRVQSDLIDVQLDSPMKQSSEMKPQSPSSFPSEADLLFPALGHSDGSIENEGCIAELNEVRASSQEHAEDAMFLELNSTELDRRAPGGSPVRALALSFNNSPSASNTSPQAESMDACEAAPASPCMMSTTPHQVTSPSTDSAGIPANERSPSANSVMTENTDTQGLDFERYLQPVARCSLSPVCGTATERFSLGTTDAEMESPLSQAEESAQDVIRIPTAFPRMAPLVFSPWTEQQMETPLLFTPEQRSRVRPSVCDRDLMMFTPPSSK